MAKCTGPHLNGGGFTLVELLLAVSLVLLLVGAAVFSFSTLLGGTQLEEGSGQVESLLRFARAHAANTGRRVQLVFDEQADAASPASSVRMTWEPDPLGQPGYFEDVTEGGWQIQSVNELLQFEAVQLFGTGEPHAGSSAQGGGQESEPFSPITFYPDGSSDSAELILASHAPDDEQRISVRLDGTSGTIRHQTVNAATAEQPADGQRLVKANNAEKTP